MNFEEKRKPKKIFKASTAATGALAAFLNGVAPLPVNAQIRTEPTSIVKPLEKKKSETEKIFEHFKIWSEKKRKDRAYVEAFVDFYKDVIDKKEKDDWFKKRYIEYYVSDFDVTYNPYSFKYKHWYYWASEDYKKLEELYGNGENFLKIFIEKDLGYPGILFGHVFQNPNDQSLYQTILNPERLKNSEVRNLLFERLNKFLKNLLESEAFAPNFLSNILKFVYPAMNEEEKKIFTENLKEEYLKSSNMAMIQVSSEVIKIISEGKEPEEFKLQVIKKRWANMSDSWKSTKDEMSFADFKEFFQHLHTQTLEFTNIKNKPGFEFYKKVYKEGLKVFVRAAMTSDGNSFMSADNTLQTFNSSFKKISMTGVNNLDKMARSYLNSGLISKTDYEGLIIQETINLLLENINNLSDEEKVIYLDWIRKIEESIVFNNDKKKTGEQFKLFIKSFKDDSLSFSLVNLWAKHIDTNWISDWLENKLEETAERDPFKAVQLLQILNQNKSISYVIFKLTGIKDKIYSADLSKFKGTSLEKEFLEMIQNDHSLFDAIIDISFYLEDSFHKDTPRYKVSVANLPHLLDLLKSGHKYILTGIYKELKHAIKPKYYEYMLDKKYPIRKIVDLSIKMDSLKMDEQNARAKANYFMDKDKIEKSGNAWWNILGRKYDSTRSVVPTNTWENQQLFLRWDSVWSRYKSLQVLDLKEVGAYLDIYRFLSANIDSVIWSRMLETLDYSEFDSYVHGKINSGKLVEIVDEISNIGNVVDPMFARIVLARALIKNKEAVDILLTRWGFEPEKNNGKRYRTDYKIANLDDIRKLEIFFTISPWLEKNDYFNFSLDRNFIDQIKDLNTTLEIYSRLTNLQQKVAQDIAEPWEVMNSIKTLTSKIFEFIQVDSLGIENIKVGNIEKIRDLLNRGSRDTGNKFLNTLADNYLSKNPDGESLRKFIIEWYDFIESSAITGDAKESYRLIIQYAFTQLEDSVKADKNLQISEFLQPLTDRKFVFQNDPNKAAKAVNRIAGGQMTLGQVAAKVANDLIGNNEVYIDKISKTQFGEHSMKDGVKVEFVCTQDVCTKENAEAVLVRFDNQKVGFRLEVSETGVVDTKRIISELGGRYIGSAPIAFSGGARLVLDFAYKEGKQVGSHIKTDGRDGLVVTNKEGQVIIMNKRGMNLIDFEKLGINIPKEYLEKVEGGILLPTKRLAHKLLLDKIMFENNLSAVTNMLLASGGQQIGKPLLDGNDSRRLFLKMKDGSFGIITSYNKGMSTDKLVKIALKCGASEIVNCASELVYMDTGMYDSYELIVNGVRHILGHADTQNSTQRAFMYYKN